MITILQIDKKQAWINYVLFANQEQLQILFKNYQIQQLKDTLHILSKCIRYFNTFKIWKIFEDGSQIKRKCW